MASTGLSLSLAEVTLLTKTGDAVPTSNVSVKLSTVNGDRVAANCDDGDTRSPPLGKLCETSPGDAEPTLTADYDCALNVTRVTVTNSAASPERIAAFALDFTDGGGFVRTTYEFDGTNASYTIPYGERGSSSTSVHAFAVEANRRETAVSDRGWRASRARSRTPLAVSTSHHANKLTRARAHKRAWQTTAPQARSASATCAWTRAAPSRPAPPRASAVSGRRRGAAQRQPARARQRRQGWSLRRSHPPKPTGGGCGLRRWPGAAKQPRDTLPLKHMGAANHANGMP